MSLFLLDIFDVDEAGEVVTSLKTGNVLTLFVTKKGYVKAGTMLGRKAFNANVHRLVATKYVPNPDGKPFVNHKDGNKRNNHKDNLEWVTHQENMDHAKAHSLFRNPTGENHGGCVLTDAQVEIIRERYVPRCRVNGGRALAREFGVDQSTVSVIVNCKSRK